MKKATLVFFGMIVLNSNAQNFPKLLKHPSVTTKSVSKSATANIGGSGSPTLSNLPTIIPPSPEASSLGKYVEVPIGLYTGTPDISIPITTVKEGSLSVPISLSYHASGIKVEEVAGWAGLGWTLNAGGAVTRVTRGSPDDLITGTNFLQLTALNPAPNTNMFDFISSGPVTNSASGIARQQLFADIADYGCTDSEPDMFMFNFNGYTGKMMYNWSNPSELVISCTRKIKVNPIYKLPPYLSTDKTKIIGWDITGDDGTIYKFRDIEKAQSKSSMPAPSCKRNIPSTSAWFLSEIEDVNSENKIFLEYIDYILQTSTTDYEYEKNYLNGCQTLKTGTSSSSNDYYGKHLSRIRNSTNSQIIDFIPSTTDRTDLPVIPASVNLNNKSLDKIVIKDNRTNELTFQLNYDYSSSRLMLNSIVEKNGAESKPPYLFEYYLGILPEYDSKSIDHWGYYNGKANTTLLPSTFIYGVYKPGANREVDFNFSRVATLNKIIFPMGGVNEFNFFSNTYEYVNNSTLLSLGQFQTIPINESITAGTANLALNGTQEKTFTINQVGSSILTKTPVLVKFEGYGTSPLASQKPILKIINTATNISVLSKIIPQNLDDDGVIEIEDVGIELLPGTYKIVAICNTFQSQNQNYSYGKIDISFENTTTTPINSKEAGGLKIVELKEYTCGLDTRNEVDGFGGVKSKSFFYNNSGVVYNEPKYVYNSFDNFPDEALNPPSYDPLIPPGLQYIAPKYCQFVMRQSTNNVPFGMTQGSHVGYRQVTVSETLPRRSGVNNEERGQRTLYKFSSPFEYPDITFDSPPFQPFTSQSYKTGLLIEQIESGKSFIYPQSTAPVISRHILNTYDFQETQIGGIKISTNTTPQIQKTPGNLSDYYFLGTYQNILGTAQLKESIVKTYGSKNSTHDNSTQFTTQKTETTFDALKQRVKSTSTTIDNANKKIQEFYYPDEFINKTVAQVSMVNKNFISEPIEIISKEFDGTNTVFTGSGFSQFDLDLSKIRKTKSFELQNATSLSSFDYAFDNAVGIKDLNYKTEVLNIQKYDDKGNILQYQENQGDIGKTTSIVWGYDKSLPIAKVENASYARLQALPNFNLVGLNGNTYSDALYQSEINVLRDKLNTENNANANENAMVSSYTYKPLYGIQTITDASKIKTNYIYDLVGRLKQIKDHNDYILQDYKFEYGCCLKRPVLARKTSFKLNNPVTISIDNYSYTNGCAGNIVWSNGMTGNTITYTPTELSPITAKCVNGVCESAISDRLFHPNKAWLGSKIGTPPTDPSFSFHHIAYSHIKPVNLIATGNLSGTSDNIGYFHRTYANDIDIKLIFDTPSNADGMRSGIMIRQSTNAGSKFIALVATGDPGSTGNGFGVIYRDVDNTATKLWGTSPITNSRSIRIKKTGNNYEFFYDEYNSSTSTYDWKAILNNAPTGNSPFSLTGNFEICLVSYNENYATNPVANSTGFVNIIINGQAISE